MKKKLQKVFAMVLALSMVMSLMSVTAFAEGETGSGDPAPAATEEPTLNAKVQVFNYDKSVNTNEDGLGPHGYKFFHGDYKYSDGTASNTVDGPGKSGSYNVPVMTGSLAEQKYPEVLVPIAQKNADGTPMVDGDGNPVIEEEVRSLKYLFDGTYRKGTMTDGGGLFQQDDDGYWYYDSIEKAAYFNGTKFELSDKAVRPGWQAADGTDIQTSNFLPFNDPAKADSSGAFPQNVAVDLWFGLTVEFDFYMTEDGQVVGPDGTSKQDMVFQFKGDDDVFVYIDDQLVLDIGGTHGAQSGSINFANGAVVDPTTTRETNPVTKSLSTIFAGDDNFDMETGTFKKYTKHTLKFFYMERGGNISYCYLNFNMPVVPAGTVSVKATTEGILPTQAENQDYKFLLLDENGNPVANKPYRLNDPTVDEGLMTDEDGYFTLKADETAYFVSFDSTQLGNYSVKEVEVPGYFEKVLISKNEGSFNQKDDNEIGFTVQTNQTNDIVFKNVAKTSDFSFLKTDTAGNPLKNAFFTLVGNGYDETEESNEDGVVKFEDVPFGTFTLKEVKENGDPGAPSGYEADTSTWTVNVEYVDSKIKVSLDDYSTESNGALIKMVDAPAETGEIVAVEGVEVPEGQAATQQVPKTFAVENKKLNELTIEKTVEVDVSAYDPSTGETLRELDLSSVKFTFDITGAKNETVELTGFRKDSEEVDETGKVTKTFWKASKKLENLPAGTYEIEEISTPDFTGAGYKFMGVTFTVGEDETNFVSLSDGDVVTIEAQNRYKHIPNAVTVEATKWWDDEFDRDGKRPDSVTFGLFVGGEKIDEIEVNANTGKRVEKDGIEGYEVSFLYDCVKYPSDVVEVREIAYTVDGDPVELGENDKVPGYEMIANEVTGEKPELTANITNQHIPERLDIAVRKVWAESALGRERQVTVWLKADGEKVRDSERTLSAENSWYTVYEDLYKYENGVEIKYEVTENKIGNNWSASVDETTEEYFISLFTEVHTEESASAYLAANTADWETMDADAQQGLIAQLVGQPLVDTSVFDNDNMTHVVVTNSYGGGGYNPPPTKEEPKDPPKEDPTVIEDEEPPLAMLPDEDVPLAALPEDIFDEEVPLAMAPATGDVSALWLALSALSGTGLAGVSLLGRKKRDEE